MKTGRPTVEKSLKKAHVTAVRLRPEERSLVEKAASIRSQKLSDWIRETLLEKASLETRGNS